MNKKIIKLEIDDLIELEKENLFRKGYVKKELDPHIDVSNMVSKDTYRTMSGKDKKIHQGYKIINDVENE